MATGTTVEGGEGSRAHPLRDALHRCRPGLSTGAAFSR